jgi:hypothetical protein
MADTLRVTVTRRDGKPFPKARVALEPTNATAAPHFIDADANGQVTFKLVADATLELSVSHPKGTGSSQSSPAWDKNDTAYWPVSMKLVYMASQHAIAMQQNPPQLTYFAEAKTAAGALFDLEVRLYRVRLMDDVVHGVLQQIGVDYPVQLTGQQSADLAFEYSTTPLLDGNDVVQHVTAPRPLMDPRVGSMFEVAARKDASGNEEKPFAPKCVGAWLPLQVVRGGDTPPSVMIYFRPQANQDFAGQASGYPAPVPQTVTTTNFQLNRYDPAPYSKAHYYFDWFFLKTFEFAGDPWQPGRQFAMGFRNQIKAAKRKLGIIAPVPEAGAGGLTHGHAVEPAFLAELTAEIIGFAHMSFDRNLVVAPVPPAPTPGRIALSAHSNGNDVLSQFVSNLRGAPAANILKQQVREIYLLDPAGGGQSAAFDNCASYVQSLPNPDDGALRCYSQISNFIITKFPDLHKALARPNHPPSPYDDTSERLPSGTTLQGLLHRTAAFLPLAAWPNPPTGPGSPFNDIHSFIPSTMLTHALLLSQFPAL